jgi:hypothetical protein
MITVLYRISSGEVLKISLRGQIFDRINSNIFAYLIDPSFPDGTDNREIVDGQLGPGRILGYQKIAIPGSGLVRNGTQEEIDGFQSLQQEDDNLQDELGAKVFLETHPRFRKIFVGILKLLVDQLLEKSNVKQNEMITQWNQFKSGIASATSLDNIKSGVAGLPAINPNLPETATLDQIRNQLKSMISKDD